MSLSFNITQIGYTTRIIFQATPILPPDTLSLVCVWYALLTEDINMVIDDDECIDDGNGGCLVEDELGLSSSSTEEDKSELQSSDEEYPEALDYIRSMIKTTLPNTDGEDTGSSTTSSRYINASSWQRARVQLPRAWLHGVRIEGMNDDASSSTSSDSNNSNNFGQVPLQYILQCSVDDGSKMLEIPLFSIPSSSSYSQSSIPLHQKKKIDISNEILQEITHNYILESSASFISLALYHRYNKSGEGSADSPTLKVSTRLLDQLVEMQDNEKKEETSTRYCWTLPNTDDDINTIIQNEGLPLYRSLASIKEEDKRVLGKIKGQNFGKDDIISSLSSSSSSFSNDNTTNSSSSSTYRSTPQGTESSAGIGNVKKSLTLEQQATQEKLKAAWKIAQESPSLCCLVVCYDVFNMKNRQFDYFN